MLSLKKEEMGGEGNWGVLFVLRHAVECVWLHCVQLQLEKRRNQSERHKWGPQMNRLAKAWPQISLTHCTLHHEHVSEVSAFSDERPGSMILDPAPQPGGILLSVATHIPQGTSDNHFAESHIGTRVPWWLVGTGQGCGNAVSSGNKP